MINRIQLISNADDVNIMINGKVTLIKKKGARELRLEINKSKTK